MEAVAAHRWRLPAGTRVLAAAGSQAVIQALPLLYPPGDVAILGPTYGEHAKAWSAAGHRVREVPDLETAARCPVTVVVNPNNPDGRLLPPEALRDVARDRAARGGLLVVDEAFGEECPQHSAVPHLGSGMVVLKSFGKFFGLAGLRLGFALAGEEPAGRLAARLGPWAASGPALAVARIALADEAWTNATRERLTAAASRLDSILTAGGLEVLGGTGLFRLARHHAAAEVYERLGRAGILVRAFAHRPDLLRFGLPADAAEEARLARALSG